MATYQFPVEILALRNTDSVIPISFKEKYFSDNATLCFQLFLFHFTATKRRVSDDLE